MNNCNYIIYIISFFISIIQIEIKSQSLFYQDIFNGGVTAGGYSPGSPMGSFNGTFEVGNILAGSSIKKAFLFSGRHGQAEDLTIIFSNSVYIYNLNNLVSSTFTSPYGGNSGIHVIDVTDEITLTNTQYSIEATLDGFSTENIYNDFYLLILYENNLLSKVNFAIHLNDQNFLGSNNYQIQNINPINSSQQVALSLHCGYICDIISDGHNVNINGNSIGLIGGADNNSNYCGGPIGNFIYENNTLTGLNNDVSNNTMSGNDVIAQIQNYIINLSTVVDYSFTTQTSSNNTNALWTFTTIYDTPCSSFNTTITSNQLICKGDSTQLEATGGIDYEWSPSTGLSCDDCPNPMAYPENSTTYTCRIWSTDSCSKVLPVRVNVSNPKPDTVVVTPAICGSENGKIQVGNIPFGSVTEPPYTYSINGESQSDTLFANLAGGNYELTVTDANGCTWSDSITVEEEIKTVAFSLIDPKEGHTPFVVTANAGSSQYATDYLWLTDNTEIPGEDFEYEYLAADEYDLCLLAWNNEPRCADTVCYKIIVHPEYFVRIPNVFTPNNDGDNDIFSIKIQEVQSIKWQIYNRWGNVLNHGQKNFPTGDFQTLDLWHGDTPQFKPAPDGVYYYKIDVESFGGVVEQLVGDVSLGR